MIRTYLAAAALILVGCDRTTSSMPKWQERLTDSESHEGDKAGHLPG